MRKEAYYYLKMSVLASNQLLKGNQDQFRLRLIMIGGAVKK